MKTGLVLSLTLAAAYSAAADIYHASLYAQVRLDHLTDANFATYVADARAAGIDGIWLALAHFPEGEGEARDAYLARLSKALRDFKAENLAVGAWMTGFGYGGEMAYYRDSERLTTLDGWRSGAVCPLDPLLRRTLLSNVRDVAKAGAWFILMDDDFVQSARSMVGCSCSNHLALVAKKCGRESVTPYEVKCAFTGAPNALRTAYMDVQGEVAMELARELRRAVDEVDPSVGMGLCASYTHWDVEGCDLPELVAAFAGNGRCVLRISGAPYWPHCKFPETGLADIIEFVRMQSAWTRGLDWTVFDENDPFPQQVSKVPPWRCELYDKAVIADGRLARHKYMLCYGPDRAEPGYLEAHLANMADDDALRRIFAGTDPYGVKIDCPQHRLRTAMLTGPFAGESMICALFSQPTEAFALRRHGIPTRYDGPEARDEPLALTIIAPTPDVYQIVHCDRATGEFAVLLENMGDAAAAVTIATADKAHVLDALHGNFNVVPDGLCLDCLPSHSYAAVRFSFLP